MNPKIVASSSSNNTYLHIEKQNKLLKQQNKLLKQQNELLSRQANLLDLLNDAIFSLDIHGAITYWNSGAERMYGYTKEEAIGCICHDLLKAMYLTDAQNFKDILARDGFWQGEIVHTTKEGKERIIYAVKQIILSETETPTLLESNRDITERKKAVNELSHANKRLSFALESVKVGIWDIDLVDKSQILSPGLSEIFGIELSELMSFEKIKAAIYVEDREGVFLSLEDAFIRHDEFWHKEFRIANPKKGIIWITSTGKIIFDETGTPVKIIGFSNDITKMKTQQNQLLKVEKEKSEALQKAIEMKDEFISLISHEFKTPLTVINSAVQAMEYICKNELSDKAIGFLGKIRQNSNRQLKLVNNLLDITRINAGHLEIRNKDMDIVFLTRSITESITVFAQQKSINLTFCSTVKKKIIGIDDEKYERILLNLLSNAIKFTSEGKSVSVKLYQKIINRKSNVCIQVKDQGIGIPSDKMEYIFERFGQVDSSLSRQAEGTGIGLSLVKMLVEMMEGEIMLASKEGVGSTFTVILPIKRSSDIHINQMTEAISDNRLIQATEVEFSDIYL